MHRPTDRKLQTNWLLYLSASTILLAGVANEYVNWQFINRWLCTLKTAVHCRVLWRAPGGCCSPSCARLMHVGYKSKVNVIKYTCRIYLYGRWESPWWLQSSAGTSPETDQSIFFVCSRASLVLKQFTIFAVTIQHIQLGHHSMIKLEMRGKA